MTIPRSTIKAVCTSSEAAVVRASRKGSIEKLSYAEVKQLAVQTRKLLEKWQGLGREQARAHSKKAGAGQSAANTELKAQIFRETLDNLEVRLAKLGAATPGEKKPKSKPKKARSAEHRASRAAIRKGMTAVEDLLNAKPRKKSKPATAKSAPLVTAAKPAAEPKPAAKTKSAPIVTDKSKGTRTTLAKVKVSKKRGAAPAGASLPPQRDVLAAAKQSRVVRSGKTTRMRGHVVARGKRSQARRDAKG